jgi:hypothetical protein
MPTLNASAASAHRLMATSVGDERPRSRTLRKQSVGDASVVLVLIEQTVDEIFDVALVLDRIEDAR